MSGWQAGSPIAVYVRVQCREPKTGQEKILFYCEDDSLFLSSHYLSMAYSIATPDKRNTFFVTLSLQAAFQNIAEPNFHFFRGK